MFPDLVFTKKNHQHSKPRTFVPNGPSWSSLPFSLQTWARDSHHSILGTSIASSGICDVQVQRICPPQPPGGLGPNTNSGSSPGTSDCAFPTPVVSSCGFSLLQCEMCTVKLPVSTSMSSPSSMVGWTWTTILNHINWSIRAKYVYIIYCAKCFQYVISFFL